MLLSINEAAELGINRLRLPVWADPMDHIRIDIFNKNLGPWIHLYSTMNLSMNGRDPQSLPFTKFELDSVAWNRYDGPLPDSEEYKLREQQFIEAVERASKPGGFGLTHGIPRDFAEEWYSVKYLNSR